MISLSAERTLPTRTARPLTVLVADDVQEIRQLVAQWLEEFGHSVRCAGTGREALRAVSEKPCDVVLTDILMPDGDGLDVIIALKRTRPSVRVLAFSGGGTYMSADDSLRLAKAIGADLVLSKPFNRHQILDAVEQLASGQK